MASFALQSVACCILFVIGGCARLPGTYRAIQVGKSLDKSVFPQHVVITKEPNEIRLMEMQQLLLPLGWAERNLTINLDSKGRVSSLRLEEEKYYYWIVLISVDRQVWERTLDEHGKPLEKIEPPLKHNIGITNPWFIVGCFGCWGGAALAFESEVN